jgi:hypothetical protein
MTSGKGPNELAAEWKEACNSHDLDRILALYREDGFLNLPAFEQCQEKRAAYSGANRRFAITGDGYWSGDLISIVQWVMYSLASIASPWNIALPTDCTASNL